MFWTTNLSQVDLFGQHESTASDVICELYKQALYQFGENCEPDLYRQYIFLTHRATQNFLKPLLVKRFGTLDEAKIPTLEWLNSVGSLETIARTTRSDSTGQGCTPVPTEARRVPDWYIKYLRTSRWDDVKRRASELWSNSHFQDGQMRCSFNHRHEFSEWHHADYGLVGSGAEFRTLVPLCSMCHKRLRIVGPAIPYQMPDAVKPFIEAGRAAG